MTATTATDRTAPFVFYTERRLVQLTGRKATNLEELLGHLSVSGSSIFYHTHYLYLTHHFERPRFYNEFANWSSQALQEEQLAEQLAAMDLLAFTSVRDVRESIIDVIQKHLQGNKTALRQCPPGDEFHFCEAKSFIMPNGLVAHTVRELFEKLEQVTNSCLHFHFFEARLRLGRPTNDFTKWLEALGETKLAKRIDSLNPYGMTLEELKNEIVKVGRRSRLK